VDLVDSFRELKRLMSKDGRQVKCPKCGRWNVAIRPSCNTCGTQNPLGVMDFGRTKDIQAEKVLVELEEDPLEQYGKRASRRPFSKP
jgi:hypothetical protein